MSDFTYLDWSLWDQVDRICRRNCPVGEPGIWALAVELEKRCQEIEGRLYYPEAPAGTLVVAFTVSSATHIETVPLRRFLAWGREGLAEMVGQLAPKDWLTASLANHDPVFLNGSLAWRLEYMAANPQGYMLGLPSPGGESEMHRLLADIAYAAAQRGLLDRIEAIAASGATPAVLLSVQVGSTEPSGDRFKELMFLVGELPPASPTRGA